MTCYACIVLLMLATLLDAQIIVDPDASIDGIRLVGGPSVNDGRLEILIGSTWGTVCKNPFGTANVKVVCRMLGYNSGGNTIGNIYRSRYGYGTGQIWMDRVQCTGNEDSLAECSHLGFGNTHNRNCGHSNEVVLRCNLHAVNDIRLVGGASLSEGRVEVFVNNTWGSICDDYFDERGAITICKMSGFSHPIAEIRDIGEYGRGSGPIWLDDVGCSNLQNNLTACYHAGYGLHNCHHGDDVAVKCGDAMISGVRLVNGSSSHGFLEISANNTWLSVCNKRFELDTAKIVCKMLGFQNKAPIVRTSYVWAPGKAWEFIGDCNANMSNLTECDHYALGLTDYCGAPIISMACTTIEDVRLVGGNTSFGRAEVLVVGEWGTICDDSFNDRAATVFCRMMGRPSGVFDLGTVSGGTGQIWLDDVICHGNETTLDDCNLRYTPDPECRHVEDVWIRCGMLTPLVST